MEQSDYNWYTLELPSQGRYGVPKEIEYRHFTVAEEKDIAILTSKNSEKVIYKVLKRLVKDIDPGELSTGDRMHLLLNLRVNSYDNTYAFSWVCQFCGYKKNKHIQDLTKLHIKELPKNFKEPFDLKLPISGDVIQVRLIKAKDELEVFKMLLDMENPDEWALKFATSIVEKGTALKTKYEKLLKMHTKDFQEIKRWQNKNFHGPDLETKVKCKKCSEVDKISVPFTPEWFLPA